ncbi:flavodoxin [Paucilactobacillus suebicus]|uniref:Flavodoxin-like domain-containing protein n=1 Tax=Paucilactobacillus suebicus DSM 5007 = KCTC 3549 TaxID=1423807 RepID=A0A0R1WBJ6_9LACO|nr:flavodoxin [Paucilactobacillus suebicus]KRM12323.1 hypothetical protein FD16_GL002508 [Paucilactobacillus suebicus DSM 5007 = KCTC 3549]
MATIWYFSHEGDALINGSTAKINEGNTKIAADTLAEISGANLGKISPVEMYPFDFDEAVQRAKVERDQNINPTIHPVSANLLNDSVWFLGYPNWLGELPGAVKTFLINHDSDGRIILPFATHEGGGMGNSVNQIKQLCPNADVKIGLPIRGSRVSKSQFAFANWLTQYYVKNN